MVTAAALVLVLLHLHASDTLKEGNEAARPQPLSTSRPQPPPGPKVIPDRIHRSQGGGISRQDEDLLDLMVRIAETPAEWERIHRVLSLIGREKESYEDDTYEETENLVKNSFDHDVKDIENYTEINSIASHQDRTVYKTSSVPTIKSKISTSPTTLIPLTNTPVSDIDNHEFELENVKDTDTGWPDFEEAIVKKVKIPHSIDENDILETNWLEDDWLETNWNSVLRDDKYKNPTFQSSKSVPTVNSKSSVSDRKMSSVTDNDAPRSRLFRDPKILEFRFKDEVALQNHTVEHNMTGETNSSAGGRSDRPVFVYHRVTTSPQERRGNSAYIAVSVVRQPEGSPPATTLPPPWGSVRNLQKEPSLSNHHMKHPHWRQHKGRRHRRTQSHAHTHH